MMTTASVFLLVAAAAAGPAPDAVRIAEIARHLPKSQAWVGQTFVSVAKKGPKALEEPIPDCPDELYLLTTKTGDRERYQKGYSRRVQMLEEMAGTACATGDERYLKRTVELLEAICSERCWTMPAHDLKLTNFKGTQLTIDLGAALRAYMVAGTLAQLGERLSPDVREKAMAELERRVFSLYRATNRDSADAAAFRKHGNWWFFVRSNWSAVCHSYVVRAALAVLPDRTDRAGFVEAAERGMRFFLESFLPDGYCSEGMGYWSYGYGHFLDLTMALRRATGSFVDLAKLPRAKEAMSYAFGYTLDGAHCPVFADGGGGRASPHDLDKGCEIWPEFAALRTAALPPRTFFPDAQVYIGRARRISLGVKGGTNAELHNHNDLGSWTLYADGEEVAGDPGGEIYTARTFSKDRYVSDVLNSYGHPVPRVGGELQLTGGESKAEVVRKEFSDVRDVFSVDISSAYPATRGKRGAVVRTVALDRAEESVAIGDRLKADGPVAFESAVVSYRKPCPLVPSARGGAWHLEEKEIKNPGRRSPHRYAVVFDGPVAEAEVVWSFKAK